MLTVYIRILKLPLRFLLANNDFVITLVGGIWILLLFLMVLLEFFLLKVLYLLLLKLIFTFSNLLVFIGIMFDILFFLNILFILNRAISTLDRLIQIQFLGEYFLSRAIVHRIGAVALGIVLNDHATRNLYPFAKNRQIFAIVQQLLL